MKFGGVAIVGKMHPYIFYMQKYNTDLPTFRIYPSNAGFLKRFKGFQNGLKYCRDFETWLNILNMFEFCCFSQNNSYALYQDRFDFFFRT